MIAISLVVFATASVYAAAETSVSDFLRELMREPSRVPVYGEGLKVADQIQALPQKDVRATLPVIFEALTYERDAVKLNAALLFTPWPSDQTRKFC